MQPTITPKTDESSSKILGTLTQLSPSHIRGKYKLKWDVESIGTWVSTCLKIFQNLFDLNYSSLNANRKSDIL